jgi:hypothetical protein
MNGITELQIWSWIEQCDDQLKQLQNAKDFLYRSYYERDLINYSVEENLRDRLGDRIRDIKSKREFLTRMLDQIHTNENVEMFEYQFPDTLVNQLPEDLRKEFFDYVYEM